MLRKKTIEDVNLEGKRVIARVDFNVPLDENRRVANDLRIRAAVPTIEHVLSRGAPLVLMSHLGRPGGRRDPKFSLAPVFERLGTLIGAPLKMAPDCVGDEVKGLALGLSPGAALLLENLRFHEEETRNDEGFARELASLADVYVNDAFGAAHRAHASTEGITRFVGASVAGFLMKKEIDYLENALENPRRPFTAVLGGAKVSDKISVIERLLDRVDVMLIGGGMCFTFLKALGGEVGNSKLEEDRLDEARRILRLAREKGKEFLLPADVVAASAFSETAETRMVPVDSIPAGWMGLDIGEETAETYRRKIMESGTVLWNGPMGVFEMKPFAAGTRALADAVAESGCVSIVGGGDSAAAVYEMGFEDRITHISTGGGAALELLEGRKLPGVEALDDAV
ncbi:MAG: phosphoglycerate kinase [bacterium]